MEDLGKKLLVDVQTACQVLGRSDKTVREMVDRRDLEACRVRASFRISTKSMEEYLKRINPEGFSLLSINEFATRAKAIQPKTAAKMMDICTRGVYRLIRDGVLPATKEHGTFRLSPQVVQDFVEMQIESYRDERGWE